MLRPLAIGVFGLACMGAAVSILAQWPYQFTGQGDPDRVPQEFLFMGALLAPPLPLLLLFGASTFLSGREDRLGFMATVGMIPALGVMTVGSLGEALSAPSRDVPRFAQVAGGLLGAMAFFALLIAAAKAALTIIGNRKTIPGPF
jgi:hypothetical protein